MALDPYAACPCGSGKKFKWCCQPIHVHIDQAFQQYEQGQKEAALRLMDQLTQEHSGNPEVWGRKAELLYNSERAEEAEAALEKAFAINPHYPFGHLLRGSFRRAEGELAGALLCFRKATEYYDPEAKGILAQLWSMIFDCEMQLNRPVAGRAALQLAARYNVGTTDLRDALEKVFGQENPNLPASAKKEHQYLHPKEQNRTAWDQALALSGTGKLADAAKAFDKLTQVDPDDAAAWFNLALTHAWQANNAAALEALDRYVALEKDEARAAAAWALGEVLRVGQGMEDQADYVEYAVLAPMTDPQAFLEALQRMGQEGILAGVRVAEQEGMITGMMLEKPAPALTPELEAKQSPHLAAFFTIVGNIMRLWSVLKERLDRAFAIVQQRAGAALGQPYHARGPAKFFDIVTECLIFPKAALSETEIESRFREHLEKFYEETWLHRPLKSLGGVPPIDAAGHAVLKKKLRGVIQFLQECSAMTKYPYDFDRLRRKLGLDAVGQTFVSAGAPETPVQERTARLPTLDIAAMGAAELAGLSPDALQDEELETAFQTALKIDARDLAAKFAQTAVARPPRADKPDRYAFFNHLTQTALANRDFTAALDQVNAGEKDDCEHNDGRRRNDYELRRGQLLAKSGDLGQAQEVFDRLIARVPNELKVRGSAAEAMLSAKNGPQALGYAEAGLAEARKQQQRDSEEYFLELAAAAKKLSAS
ncbi:MAG: tetratricopeptide repeat protein [Gemmataceae bacterium]|nr:tetratricopeptide repeat protein [Gemmataceae bacterium]